MKKTLSTILVVACLMTLLLPVRAAEQEPKYDNTLDITGTAVEELQTKLDALPDDAHAGDVLINIAQGLSSGQRELDISIPTNKGITSLTLRHEGDTPISITTAGTELNFFANGIPLIIDKGVNFGKFPKVYKSVDVRVFGGSKNADLTGNTSITINGGGAITGSIYGGGYNGSVNGDTTIIAHGAYGSINGGGLARLDRDSLTSITADVSGKATIVADTDVVPTYEGVYVTHLYLNGSVTGGGCISAVSWSGAPNVPSDCVLSAQVKGGVSITADCQVSSAVINGSGWITATRSADEGATYNADVTGNVDITLGGKFQQAADYATSRWICAVMGSGYAGYTTENANISAQVHGDVNITAVQNDEAADANIESGIGTILGGGYVLGNAKHNVSVDGNVTITTSRKAPLIRVGSNEGRLGIIGGGYASGGVANVTKDVKIHICKAPGQADGYVNMKNVVGGGAAGQNGVARIGGDIDIKIDDDISFQGGRYQAISDDIKLGVTGGGWVNGKGGNADVTGTVNISIGKGATFIRSTDDYPAGCRVIGGGSIDEVHKPKKDENGNPIAPVPSAKTGNITVTLNGTTNALEELFCTSMEGYSPSASATVTLKDSHVGWMYDKDITDAVNGNQSVTLNLLGTSQLDYAQFAGWDYPNPKMYHIEVGDGTTPTEAVIGDYYIEASYGNQPSFCQMNVHVSNNAVMKKAAGVMLTNPYNITIDQGGTLRISEDEEMYGSLAGGGTIDFTAANKRLRMIQSGAEFTGTIKAKVTSPEVNQVIATTVQDGTKGTFVYDGDDFVIKKRPDAGDNFDWYLADPPVAPTVTAPTAVEGLVYTGEPQPLVTGGAAAGGTLLYSLDGINYDAAVPTGTDANTYTVYYKVQGDDDYTDTEPANFNVTIDKANQSAPAAPQLDTKTTDSVTLKTIAGAEYSKDGGDTWQSSPTFSGLVPGKTYTFIARYAGTANYNASSASQALQVTTNPAVQPVTYQIAAAAGPGGTINPSGQVNVQSGRDQSFIITPAAGYTVSDVLVDGRSVGAVRTYAFRQVTGSHTIQAVFVSEQPGWSNCVHDHFCPIWPFQDADVEEWYHDGVHYCLDEGLMQGYGNGKFGPNNTLTRAMLAQILYNKAGKPAVTGASPFTDVASTAWYAAAVNWAASTGVVNGYGNGKYGPEDNITREQLAAMLWRYAGKPDKGGTLEAFTDGKQTSAWAMDALRWAVAQGIVTGRGNGILAPRGNATRAEAAAMLQRYLEGAK